MGAFGSQTKIKEIEVMNANRSINGEVLCHATIREVWDAWTTEEGIKSFFASAAEIEMKVDGKYEIIFHPDAEPGFRGSEGATILAIQQFKMLAFTWNAPPHLADVRNQKTHVVIRFEAQDNDRTRVIFHHDGWGTGGQWDEAFNYFSLAWLRVVLPRLKKRFDR